MLEPFKKLYGYTVNYNTKKLASCCSWFFGIIFILSSCTTANPSRGVQQKTNQYTVTAKETPSPNGSNKIDETPPPLKYGEKLPGIDSLLPVKSYRHTGVDYPVVALTLDACSGKIGGNFDDDLLIFLEENSIPVTFFLTPSWVRQNIDCFIRILNNPKFEIALHGLKHRPCFVTPVTVYGITSTTSEEDLRDEVWGGEDAIKAVMAKNSISQTLFNPKWFRAGTAVYDEKSVEIIRNGGLRIAGFSTTLDQGATLPEEEVYQKTINARAGEILLAHFNHPEKDTGKALVRAIPVLLEKGYIFITLSEQLGSYTR